MCESCACYENLLLLPSFLLFQRYFILIFWFEISRRLSLRCFMALTILNRARKTLNSKVLQNKLLLSRIIFQAVSFRRSNIKICFPSVGKAFQFTSKATNDFLRTFLVTVHFFMKSLGRNV